MSDQKQFTLVLPIKISSYHQSNELDRLRAVLLPSLNKFVDARAIHTFFIVCKDDETEEIKKALANASSLINIEVRSENTLLKPEVIANTKGWYIQQLIKLGIAKIIKTPYYLVLDTDCFLTKPFSYENLFCHDKLITNTESWTVHEDWWRNSLTIMDMSVDQVRYEPVMSVTPQVLKTDLVCQLLDFIDHKAADTEWQTYLAERKFTEFTLYWLFLIKNNLTQLYHLGTSPTLLGNALWQLYKPQDPSYFLKILPKRFRPDVNLTEENQRLIQGHIDDCFKPGGNYSFSLVQSNIDGISIEWLSGQFEKYLG